MPRPRTTPVPTSALERRVQRLEELLQRQADDGRLTDDELMQIDPESFYAGQARDGD